MNLTIDYDLRACLEYNPQSEFNVDNIKDVLAVWEGENDRDAWRWILKLNDGRFVFLKGACDYTGWDCQSWANSYFTSSPIEACLYEKNEENNWNYDPDVYFSLIKQLEGSKIETWREKKDKEFGVDSTSLLGT